MITTSKTLLKRKECPPGTYLVNPRTTADLEADLVNLLLLHSVTLQPRKFLTRCVVCNGKIKEVYDASEKKTIFADYGFPGFDEDLDVFRCCKCGQGYWWSDAPNSSASRVKDAAAHLLSICSRGGVPTEGDLDFFDFVDVDKERELGELERQNEPKDGVDEVISWLKDEKLCHEFNFRSAYASEGNGSVDGELNPFTNVTSDFVGALDYIFFEQTSFQQNGRLFIPLNLRTLNWKELPHGWILPSDSWPSDHLAIGAAFTLKQPSIQTLKKETQIQQSSSSEVTNTKHNSPQLGCKCGCVPNILSLFQMAELRKQAKLAQQRGTS